MAGARQPHCRCPGRPRGVPAAGLRATGARVSPEPGLLLDGSATAAALRALVDRLEHLDPADSLVFFFAGHGHATERVFSDGKIVTTGYVIPVDGRGEASRERRWLRVDTLLSELSRIPPRHILVILDACFSGMALQTFGSFVRARGNPRKSAWSRLAQRRSRRVIASTLSDEVARDNRPDGAHSPFAACLIDALIPPCTALGRGQTHVTGSELGLYLQKHVAVGTGAGQIPDFGFFELNDGGELLIELPPPSVAVPAPEPLPELVPAAGRPGWRVVGLLFLALIAGGVAAFAAWPSDPAEPVPPTAPPERSVDPCAPLRAEVEASNPFVRGGEGVLVQRYEISEAEWDRWEQCRGASRARHASSKTPRVRISHADATSFCAWLGGRLPSRTEWRRALVESQATLRDGVFDPRAPGPPSRRACDGICSMVDGVQELTSDTTSDGLVYAMGGAIIMDKEMAKAALAGTAIPVAHAGSIIGARCARSDR